MLGDKISSAEAEKMGMIYKAVADEAFENEISKIAQKLAQMPTKGLGLTKRALNESYENNLNQQLSLEDKLQTEAGQSYDYQEGVNAFLEKRNPQFKGE
jgi:2-(1,2-epoxy-1,2-dihydrophenyl)acetyl-CoA isomerase